MVKPRDMRSDYEARSLYFHSYAVRDHLNMENFDDTSSFPYIGAVLFELLLHPIMSYSFVVFVRGQRSSILQAKLQYIVG